MRTAILTIMLLFISSNLIAQNFYETRWISNGVTYTGLLIYYSDDDAIMRVNFTSGESVKVAEFKCFGEYIVEDGFEGYLLDGRNGKIVYGNNDLGYSADNFIFEDNGDSYETPIHIDDAGLEKENPNDQITKVDYWKEISTDQFTETYINYFFRKNEPYFNILLSYHSQNNLGNEPKDNHRISSISYGENKWTIVMSVGTGYTGQTWNLTKSYPSDWILEKWDENYYITSISNGGDQWALSMSKGTGFTDQICLTKSSFPDQEIAEEWEEGYHITSICYGEGEWVIIMSKDSGFEEQSFWKGAEFPTSWIDKKWDEGKSILSVGYGGGAWAVVMGKGAGFTKQTYWRGGYYPRDWIKEKWDENYDISSVCFGGGEWMVVMSLGMEYYTQTWKTTTHYPKDWIREKWDGENTIQNNESVPAEDATLHLIVVSNTLVNDIGASCKVDRDNTVNEFQTICDELEIKFKKTEISDRDFSKKSVNEALTNLNPLPNDIVVFVYSGHGFRWSNQSQKYPNIDLRYSNYESISESTTLNLYDIYNTITGKGARLNLIIGDCCNSNIGISNRGGESSPTSRRQTEGKVDKLWSLFINSSGDLIATAAKPSETSCGNNIEGGYFINSFFSAISKETSRLNTNSPSWDNIVVSAISSANYKTQNIRGCNPQNGFYYSTIK